MRSEKEVYDLRLKHRRADAEHIRPATNPTQVSFRKDWLISYERSIHRIPIFSGKFPKAIFCKLPIYI